jgi:hypothetical protein
MTTLGSLLFEIERHAEDVIAQPSYYNDDHFQQLQIQSAALGVSIVEVLLTRSALYWAIKSNNPPYSST